MLEEKDVKLELNTERVIVFDDRDKEYKLTCRRITSSDWEKYFAGILITSEQKGKERISVIDVTSPRVALAEAVLVKAEGYKVSGDAELMSLTNWQKRIPLNHRQKLGETLADVRPSTEAGELVIYPEAEEVLIDAMWSYQPKTEDWVAGMWRFKGLKHILRTPTDAQHKRFSAEASRSRVVGGSRSGKTIYGNASPLLAKLYDELVVGVEGYTFDGEPLSTPDVIRREMDMLHKVMAAQELFQPQNTASLAESEEE